MAEQKYPCENCKFRAHYDKDEETKAALREKYSFKKYQ